MEVWIVVLPLSSDLLTDEMYQQHLRHVDTLSQARVQRFYHRQDAWRCLVGMHLPRALLKERGIALDSVSFGRTDAGKPFIESLTLSATVGYNITHDNDIVAMVSQLGDKEYVDKIGIDVMKRALPKGETVRSFLRAIEDTLTQSELGIFTPNIDTELAVRYIFLLWTVKEAYTKALGLGLGFDFKRIEYNIPGNSVLVDGSPAFGWAFHLFEVRGHSQSGVYQGAVAIWIGGQQVRMDHIASVDDDPRFLFKELAQLSDDV